MDAHYAKEILKALGFKIDTITGEIHGETGRYYGCCYEKYISTIDGNLIDYRKIPAIESFIIDPFNPETFMIELESGVAVNVPSRPKDEYVIRKEFEPLKMPKTVAQICEFFPKAFPTHKEHLYYDELLDGVILNRLMIGEENRETEMDDKTFSVLLRVFEERLREMGCTGTMPSEKNILHALNNFLDKNSKNSFRDWLRSLKWDGKKRVRSWFRNLFGATAPALNEADEKAYVEGVSEAWFMGAVSRAFEETKHEIVPILISPQGIGKSSAIRYTAGKDMWYSSTMESMMDVKRFMESVKGAVIVELEECDQLTSKKSENSVKKFISATRDTYRSPYARFAETHPRHFIMIGTSNYDQIFLDPTGNRRFYPMICNPKKSNLTFSLDRTIGQNEVEQVWAEAYDMYRNNVAAHVPVAVEQIAKTMQDYSSNTDVNLEAISNYLNDVANAYYEVDSLISPTQIAREVFKVQDGVIKPEIQQLIRDWYSSQDDWVRESKPKYIKGVGTSRCYRRVKRSTAVVSSEPPIKLGLVATKRSSIEMKHIDVDEVLSDTDRYLQDRLKDLDSKVELINEKHVKKLTPLERDFADLLQDHGLREGDSFSPDIMSDRMRDELLNGGYIYMERAGVYKVFSDPRME